MSADWIIKDFWLNYSLSHFLEGRGERKEMGPINQEFLRVLSIFLVLLTSGRAETLLQDQILIMPFTLG